ncbi:MAG: HEAT repeat domain-containing protein [Desulfobulbaceae bacterium]|uniref:HEAT repeat domain-containing protein n=1 Tax=Candidatus Desulfatifera sulfidica TaxID=2841691 RepID=A0A8J6NAI7_9BACT|nr:HEAT repeat domain-containing protein [Candidatus Desulfatifera sulfidica]
MKSRQRKSEILTMLAHDDLEVIMAALEDFSPTDLINPLFSALYRSEEQLRWHAVSVLGQIVPRLARQEMEAARIVMRRFLWSLNDESGGIGWGAPEAMAEIMAYEPRLLEEYIHMLISYMREDGPLDFQDGNYLELPALQRGLLWGVGRLAEKQPGKLLKRQVVVDLIPYLKSEDHVVRGLAARCLGLLAGTDVSDSGDFTDSAADSIAPLLADETMIRLYVEGEFVDTTVAALAHEAMARLATLSDAVV